MSGLLVKFFLLGYIRRKIYAWASLLFTIHRNRSGRGGKVGHNSTQLPLIKVDISTFLGALAESSNLSPNINAVFPPLILQFGAMHVQYLDGYNYTTGTCKSI